MARTRVFFTNILFAIFLGALSPVTITVETVARNDDIIVFNRLVASLDQLVDYVADYPDQIIPDLLFGIILAKGQIRVAVKHVNRNLEYDSSNNDMQIKSSIIANLERLDNKLAKTYTTLSAEISENGNNSIFRVLDPYLWEIDNPFRYGELLSADNESEYKAAHRLHFQDRALPIDQSHQHAGEIGHFTLESVRETRDNSETPTETQSDFCLLELLGSYPGHPRCQMSRKCKRWETSGVSTGYFLTHRLLYFQLFRQLGCGSRKNVNQIQGNMRQLCSRIFSEANTIERSRYPEELRDLFIEQVALCGMEGFLEFLDNPEWRDVIVGWQKRDGCFGPTTVQNNSRKKRNDQAMGEGCSMHTTAVGAAALAVYIRSLAETTIANLNSVA